MRTTEKYAQLILYKSVQKFTNEMKLDVFGSIQAPNYLPILP